MNVPILVAIIWICMYFYLFFKINEQINNPDANIAELTK